MAKLKPHFIVLQGTLGGLTFVNSKTYGAHTRLPRGTHKKAVPNAVLQANAAKAKTVTGFAKALLPVLKNQYGTFIQKGLWPVLLKRLFKVPLPTIPKLAAALEGLEVNAAYPLEKIVAPPAVTGVIVKGVLKLKLVFTGHAQPPKDLRCDGYYYTVQVMWTDGKRCEAAAQETEWVGYNEACPAYEMTFAKMRWAKACLVLLQVRGGRGEKEVESFRGMGVRVIHFIGE